MTPESHGQCGFAADRPGQLFVHEQAVPASVGAEGPAAGPGERGVAPARDDGAAVDVASDPVDLPDGGRVVGVVKQDGTAGKGHNWFNSGVQGGRPHKLFLPAYADHQNAAISALQAVQL